MKRLLMGVSVLVLTLAAAGVISAQSDPRIGTWKLNVAKSKYAAAPAQSETRTYEMSGGSVMVHVDAVLGNGTKLECSYNATPDGKEYAFNCPPIYSADTISTRGSGKKLSAQIKKGGKVLFTMTDSYSSDGKVRTMTTKGVSDNGQSVNNVRVYDKQ